MCRACFWAAHHKLVDAIPDPGDGFKQVGADHQRPADALVPTQDVAGEIQQQDENQQRRPRAGN